jgi:hypothetical protein
LLNQPTRWVHQAAHHVRAARPDHWLDEVLAYLVQFTNLSKDAVWLKLELGAMPELARASLSRAIVAARRK